MRPTPIIASAGTLLWSTYNPATGTYALTARRYPGKAISSVPIAPRSVPFDASLWVQEGEFAALYSRCTQEPKLNFLGLPRWATGRGCDIYAYDFNTGKETRVSAIDTKGASEFLPAVWPGALAFFRVYGRRKGVLGTLPYLYAVGNLDIVGPRPRPGQGVPTRPKRLPYGTTRLCSTVGKPKRRECHRARDVTANSLAFRGSAAFVWEYQGLALVSFAHDPFVRRNGDSFYVRAPGGLFTTPGNACVGDPDLPAQTCRIVQASPIRFR